MPATQTPEAPLGLGLVLHPGHATLAERRAAVCRVRGVNRRASVCRPHALATAPRSGWRASPAQSCRPLP